MNVFKALFLLVLVAAPVLAATPLEDPPVYQIQWGSWGTQPGQFQSPLGIAVDADGNVYVADRDNYRIQVFTGDGAFLRQWSVDLPRGIAVSASGRVYVSGDNVVLVFTDSGVLLDQWGGLGENPGQFQLPYGIAVDADENVYVADTDNNRVQKFTSDGTLLTTWGNGGSAPGQFLDPRGIAIDSEGNVYVADYFNGRIQKFDSGGAFITMWSTSIVRPFHIAIDDTDHLYVTDNYHHKCFKFTSDGTPVVEWGSSGTGPGEFQEPRGIAVDGLGRIFVAEAWLGNAHARIQRFGQLATPVSSTTCGGLKARYR